MNKLRRCAVRGNALYTAHDSRFSVPSALHVILLAHLFRVSLLLCWLLGASQIAYAADTLTVAVAADLKFAMTELVPLFEKNHPEAHVDVVSGSSGKFYQQISNGAPFDLFFSADIEYPRKLKEAGFAISEVKPYAIGRLVLWSKNKSVLQGLSVLTDASFSKIAIANPLHAPYGKCAKASLEYYGLSQALTNKLVFGENVAQAAQFAQTDATDAAIIALSLAISPAMQGKGYYALIDERSHPTLEQGYVVLKHAKYNPVAESFSGFLSSNAARKIFRKYGFSLPEEE